MSHDPYEWTAFVVEFFCVAIGFYFSWVAGVAVIVSIITQSVWMYRKTQKEQP